MKRIKTILLLSLCALLSACNKPSTEEEPYLEINRNNISGVWKLSQWNGNDLAEGSYFHINLVRNDGTFTILQNLDAFPESPREITGRYDLMQDDVLGTVISGLYDHDSGFWAHDYVISKLTASSMVWTAVDDPDFVQLFKRIDVSEFGKE